MHLTPDILQGAYDFLCCTPPFNRWSMPPGDEIAFHVSGLKTEMASYWREADGTHHISVSAQKVSHSGTLIRSMAHEMVHLRQAVRRKNVTHNAEFCRLVARVCAAHGFDPKEL